MTHFKQHFLNFERLNQLIQSCVLRSNGKIKIPTINTLNTIKNYVSHEIATSHEMHISRNSRRQDVMVSITSL